MNGTPVGLDSSRFPEHLCASTPERDRKDRTDARPLREARARLGTGEPGDSRTPTSGRPYLWRVVSKLETTTKKNIITAVQTSGQSGLMWKKINEENCGGRAPRRPHRSPTPPPPAAAPTREHAGHPETFVQVGETAGFRRCPRALLPCALPPEPAALSRRPGFRPTLGSQGTLQAVFPEKLTLSQSSACERFKEHPGDQHLKREGTEAVGARQGS